MAIYRASSNLLRSYSISGYTATIRASPLLSTLQRVSVVHNTLDDSLDSRSPFRSSWAHQVSGDRTYATRPASRPKAHTGRTTSSARVRKPKTTTTTALETGEDDRTQTSKSKSKRATGNTKAQATKSKAKAKTAKPKAIVKVKKPLTEERKLVQAAQEKRRHVKELKKLALSPPKDLPRTPYLVINAEMSNAQHTIAGKEAAEKFRNLIPEELEHYNHIAHQNIVANREAYEAWINSLTPEDVLKANNARKTLKKLGIKGFSRLLKDERQVKRPVAAHCLFLKERHNSGDMQGMGLRDATRLILREWRELGEPDKQKYYEIQRQAQARYVQEVKDTYHRNVDLSAATPAHAVTAPVA